MLFGNLENSVGWGDEMLKDYMKAYARVFFVQSLWNTERQQNVGLLFLIKPFLEKMYTDPKIRKEAFLRHTEFFNTHPYMTGIIAAFVVKTETEIAKGNTDLISTMSQMKRSMASPLAAIGDSLFSDTLRTAIALISILLTIVFSLIEPDNLAEFGILFPFIFLVLFNLFHIIGKYIFMLTAFALGQEVLLTLAKPSFRLAIVVIAVLGFLTTLLATAAYFIFIDANSLLGIGDLRNILIFASVLVLSLFFAKKYINLKLIITVLICILWGYLER
jgi:mannose/fructose/N-acetylgalactosamine-specific phosphotransferase system component IID